MHGVGVIRAFDKALQHFDTPSCRLRKLGNEHLPRGIVPAHYEIIGQALINTAAEALGDEFTPELEASYKVVFYGIAKKMQHGNY